MSMKARRVEEKMSRTLEEILGDMRVRQRYVHARKILMRAINYASSYLEDYDLDVRKDFDSYPISISIHVYWLPRSIEREIEKLKETEKREEGEMIKPP